MPVSVEQAVPPLGRAVPEGDAWRESVDRFARPDVGRSLCFLATSVVPFLGLWGLMYLALHVSYLLVLVLAVPTAGFLVRTYIVFHDCTHGSFLPGRRANAWLGAAVGLLVFTPFAQWRHDHLVHHVTAGDLDRRGTGDVPTLTIAEYQARTPGGRLAYRLFRNPLVMFGLGPFYSMLVMPRRVTHAGDPRTRRSVWRTNLALVLTVGGLCWLLGWQAFLLVQLPLVFLAGGIGIWLFYVQHQFEYTYWEQSRNWTNVDSALRGSSYLHLPKVLQFFTGNIGLHHVHHLNPKIPNYNLQRAHNETPILRRVPGVSLWAGLHAVRLKLWDENTAHLVPWSGATSRWHRVH